MGVSRIIRNPITADQKAIANGIATLDASAKVPKNQISLTASDVGAVGTEVDPTVPALAKTLSTNNAVLAAVNAASGNIDAARLPAVYLPLSGGSLTGALTSNSPISTSNATASVSPATGASVIAGGQGIGGDQWVAGNYNGVKIGLGADATTCRVGVDAGLSNTTGNNWSAFGRDAGRANISGANWSAFGRSAGSSNTAGNAWSAFGQGAGSSSTTGVSWSAFGQGAGSSSTTGSNWVAVGQGAGLSNATGSNWVAVGQGAGRFTSDGVTALTLSINSCFIGTSTKGTQNAINENVFGYNATGNGSNTVTIGDSNIVATHLRGVVNIPNTTPSTSPTTGASVITGGQGVSGDQNIGGFSSLGGVPSGHPLIKLKQITGTTGASQGLTVDVAHGIPSGKVLGVFVVVQYGGTGEFVCSSFLSSTGYQFDWTINTTSVFVALHPTNSANILSKPFNALIFYTA